MKQAGYTNPFEGRQKRVVIRGKLDVIERIRRHREAVHGTADLDAFFDCAACGILERQLRDAVEDRDL